MKKVFGTHALLILWTLFVISILSTHGEDEALDPVRDQMAIFKNQTAGRDILLTTSNGAPVEQRDTTTLNKRLMDNEFFMDSITRFARERIQERVAHPKGAGAFGYFEVTHNVTQYIKSEFLDTVGKRTPVAVRLSGTVLSRGGSDSFRQGRGFAVKFYTKEGNFDIVGGSLPVFPYRDPIIFPGFARCRRNNPVTNTRDPNMEWDCLTRYYQGLGIQLWLSGYAGIYRGYRYMPGYGIHTYQVQNKEGKISFVRFYFTPEAGVKYLSSEEASQLDSIDPDSFTRDLYEAISCGKLVSYKFEIQVIPFVEAMNSTLDIFDTSRRIPFNIYPKIPVGRIVLNKNPENYFAEIEQLAFSPANLVPGIDGGVDKLFEARRLAYREAQYNRLGTNFQNIKVNCPYRSIVNTYNKDGEAPIGDNGQGMPNYLHNSFNGPKAYVDSSKSELIEIFERNYENFDQTAEIYEEMSAEEKELVISNIVNSLGNAVQFLQERAVAIFTRIHSELGHRISKGLKEFKKSPTCNIKFD
ncbi:unnamed protein product [Colias eurytheme]|nr:unnamed protein product [Colias eurytheme]